NGGTCYEIDIAKTILLHDESQIDYYKRIIANMVGRVLRNHKIVKRDRATKQYQLTGYENLTLDQKNHLMELCQTRLDKYVDARGKKIFEHRKKSEGYISGSIRYEVLKRAKYRCELCGISAEIKALEVDHIIPRNKGGSDEINNFQALCYSCNAMKRDRDNTDFRNMRNLYDERDGDCLFCSIDKSRIIDENELMYVMRDGYPVTDLHTLLIPKRHVTTFFELGQAEINAFNQLLKVANQDIEQEDDSVLGFNIGMNNGEVAGQTIFHCHIHLIPRRKGDVENPRGGIRHVIPGKGDYNNGK
ncbi:HIT domain-containing protein, partial [Chloroflexota bacterium]